jgi:hypothetical protein
MGEIPCVFYQRNNRKAQGITATRRAIVLASKAVAYI